MLRGIDVGAPQAYGRVQRHACHYVTRGVVSGGYRPAEAGGAGAPNLKADLQAVGRLRVFFVGVYVLSQVEPARWRSTNCGCWPSMSHCVPVPPLDTSPRQPPLACPPRASTQAMSCCSGSSRLTKPSTRPAAHISTDVSTAAHTSSSLMSGIELHISR